MGHIKLIKKIWIFQLYFSQTYPTFVVINVLCDYGIPSRRLGTAKEWYFMPNSWHIWSLTYFKNRISFLNFPPLFTALYLEPHKELNLICNVLLLSQIKYLSPVEQSSFLAFAIKVRPFLRAQMSQRPALPMTQGKPVQVTGVQRLGKRSGARLCCICLCFLW